MLPWISLTVLALCGLLYAEARRSATLTWLTKPVASLGFMATAVAGGALESTYGLAVLAALALCLVGDLLLIPKGSRPAFLAGLVSFLLGHVGYCVAFAQLGLSNRGLAAAVPLVLVGVFVLRWLMPNVETRMRAPVLAYVLVISCMVTLAAGAGVHTASWTLPLGAVLFYLSDLAVARDRFVSRGFVNRAWGLPLYYGGQLVLAASVAGIQG